MNEPRTSAGLVDAASKANSLRITELENQLCALRPSGIHSDPEWLAACIQQLPGSERLPVDGIEALTEQLCKLYLVDAMLHHRQRLRR